VQTARELAAPWSARRELIGRLESHGRAPAGDPWHLGDYAFVPRGNMMSGMVGVAVVGDHGPKGSVSSYSLSLSDTHLTREVVTRDPPPRCHLHCQLAELRRRAHDHHAESYTAWSLHSAMVESS